MMIDSSSEKMEDGGVLGYFGTHELSRSFGDVGDSSSVLLGSSVGDDNYCQSNLLPE